MLGDFSGCSIYDKPLSVQKSHPGCSSKMTPSAIMDNGNDQSSRRINLTHIAHVYYTHRNIDKARQFLDDFGFQEVKRTGRDTYYRGTGPDLFVYCAREGDEDAFGGAAFAVESEQDLEYASQTLPGASQVYELTDAPGGGRCVTFSDPVDGFPFHLVYGQEQTKDVKTFPQLEFNFVCCCRPVCQWYGS